MPRLQKPCFSIAGRPEQSFGFFRTPILYTLYIIRYTVLMASWATKRRFMYGGSVVLVFALIFLTFFVSLIYHKPTCSDGVKNGDETGIDCGGSCQLICTSDTLTPVVLWSKIFNISGDVYSAVAYVENPNLNSKNPQASYQFKIYDSDNKLITIKDGVTSIPKGKKFAIFETGIILKNSKPKSADLNFLSFYPWVKDSQKDPDVSVTYGTLLSTSTTPTINGTISNTSLQDIPKLELVVFVLDSGENVIATSRTFVDNLTKSTSQDFVFTWQKPFDGEVSVINVIYRLI